MKHVFEMLEKYTGPLKRRVLQMVARGIITAIQDDKGLQRLQVQLLADELHSQVDRVQNYGLTSVPKVGAEVIMLSVGGAREHGVIIAVDDRRYRLKPLADGEVALYSWEGSKVHLKNGNEIEVIAATKVTMTTPMLEVSGLIKCSGIATGGATPTAGNATIDGDVSATGDLSANGDVADNSGSMQEMRDTYNSHTHAETGTTTNAPDQPMT